VVHDKASICEGPLVTELKGCRQFIGEGGFGKVYRTVDETSGDFFAVKIVDLRGREGVDLEAARAVLHMEIKIMERVSHVSLHTLLEITPSPTDSWISRRISSNA
jgi:serine/threonine protein kinase